LFCFVLCSVSFSFHFFSFLFFSFTSFHLTLYLVALQTAIYCQPYSGQSRLY
jgi:hypothetical protein